MIWPGNFLDGASAIAAATAPAVQCFKSDQSIDVGTFKNKKENKGVINVGPYQLLTKNSD